MNAKAGASGLQKLKASVARRLGEAVALLMAAAVVNVVWQVASRFLLGAPSSFTDELARYLLIWIGLLGGAYAASDRSHIAVDVIPRRLEPLVGRALDAVANAAIILFGFAVMVVGGARLVWLSFELGQRTAALGIPLGIVYLVIPIAGLLIVFFASCDQLAGVGPSSPPEDDDPAASAARSGGAA